MAGRLDPCGTGRDHSESRHAEEQHLEQNSHLVTDAISETGRATVCAIAPSACADIAVIDPANASLRQAEKPRIESA
jgi:hypothetical protein